MERFSRMCSKQTLDTTTAAPPSGEMWRLLDAPVTHSLQQFPTYMQEHLTTLYPHLLHNSNSHKTLHQILAENDLLEQFYASQSLTDMRNVPDTQLR